MSIFSKVRGKIKDFREEREKKKKEFLDDVIKPENRTSKYLAWIVINAVCAGLHGAEVMSSAEAHNINAIIANLLGPVLTALIISLLCLGVRVIGEADRNLKNKESEAAESAFRKSKLINAAATTLIILGRLIITILVVTLK